MRLNARSRTLLVTATVLTFVLGGSAVAVADTGDASDQETDQATHLRDGHRDRPLDRPKDRPVDRPQDRPLDRPSDRLIRCRLDTVDRPADCPDGDDHRSIWKRCLLAAENDEVGDGSVEFRKICHRVLWRHRAWKRCIAWAAEHTDVDIENRRELWKICHRLWWNQHHAE